MVKISWHTSETRCANKVGHRSEADALKMVHKQAKLGRVRYHYRCPYCDRYHLTKTDPLTYRKGFSVLGFIRDLFSRK